MSKRNSRIKALAYFHRYGWDIVMLLVLGITKSFITVGVSCIAYSIWTLLGYFLNWKHIFCSFQNANHQSMTPNRISWDIIKKSDIFGLPILFFIFGIGAIIAQFVS